MSDEFRITELGFYMQRNGWRATSRPAVRAIGPEGFLWPVDVANNTAFYVRCGESHPEIIAPWQIKPGRWECANGSKITITRREPENGKWFWLGDTGSLMGKWSNDGTSYLAKHWDLVRYLGALEDEKPAPEAAPAPVAAPVRRWKDKLRNGDKYEFIRDDLTGLYPILGLHYHSDMDGSELRTLMQHRECGSYGLDDNHGFDLIEDVPEPQMIEGWVNVYDGYAGGFHFDAVRASREECDDSVAGNRIACIYIGPFKVGEGLERTNG